jgi:hypothetical protein
MIHKIFDSLWLGSYRIEDKVGTHSFYLSHLDGGELLVLVNGQMLKLYFSNGNQG